MPGRLGVIPENVSRRTGRYPVVDLAGGFRHPAGKVAAEFDPPDRRIVPQEAIAAIAEREGDVDLGVLLDQRKHAAFLVEKPVLPLPKAVDTFVVVSFESGLHPIGVGGSRFVVTRCRPAEMRAGFPQQFLAGAVVDKADVEFLLRLPVRVDHEDLGRNPAIDQARARRLDLDARASPRARQQRRQLFIAKVSGRRRAHSDAVRSPGADIDGLGVKTTQQAIR